MHLRACGDFLALASAVASHESWPESVAGGASGLYAPGALPECPGGRGEVLLL